MKSKLLYVLCALFVFSEPVNGSSLEAQAEAFIQKLGDDAIEILKEKRGQEYTRKKFDRLFKSNFALNTIGMQVMGKYWRQATPSQQKEFRKLFEETTLDTYTSRLREYGNEKFKVTGAQKISATVIRVHSNVIQANGSPLVIKWLVLKGKGSSGFRIGDIYIGDLSQLATQRSEYAAIIRRKGIDGLINDLRSKVK